MAKAAPTPPPCSRRPAPLWPARTMTVPSGTPTSRTRPAPAGRLRCSATRRPRRSRTSKSPAPPRRPPGRTGPPGGGVRAGCRASVGERQRMAAGRGGVQPASGRVGQGWQEHRARPCPAGPGPQGDGRRRSGQGPTSFIDRARALKPDLQWFEDNPDKLQAELARADAGYPRPVRQERGNEAGRRPGPRPSPSSSKAAPSSPTTRSMRPFNAGPAGLAADRESGPV